MDNNEIAFLFANDDMYIIPENMPAEEKIKIDLLLLVASKGNKGNCEEIINRLLESLKLLNKNISVEYDCSLSSVLKQNSKRIVSMGFSKDETGVHAEFPFDKIIHFNEKYILLIEDIISIDKDNAKKRQFWKLLQEILACGN